MGFLEKTNRTSPVAKTGSLKNDDVNARKLLSLCSQPVGAAFQEIGSTPSGLKGEEAEDRLGEFGENGFEDIQ